MISEAALTLALKPGYPTACHVLAKNILEDVESSSNSKSSCLVRDPILHGCLYRQEEQFPVYSYYWPKYFVEVSEKETIHTKRLQAAISSTLQIGSLRMSLARLSTSKGPTN